jgi:glutamyl-tRNA reductase
LTTANPTIFVIGVNHETAPLDIREQLAFDQVQLEEETRLLFHSCSATEMLILSTCNRTEIYCSGFDPKSGLTHLAQSRNINEQKLEKFVYILTDVQAFEHAARVASGLDSMVLGETQILGQMKDSYRRAKKAGTLGINLHKLFDLSFSIAKEVRTKTVIGHDSVSVAAAALKVAKTVFEDLSSRSVLFVGAGEMIRLCSQHFSGSSFLGFGFTNRSHEKAHELSKKFGGQSEEFSRIAEVLAEYDVIVSCTGSQVPILGKGAIERALKIRKHQPMVIFDLAVPRDVEVEISEIDDVFLYSIDDLGAVIREGLVNRKIAAIDAQNILSERIKEFVDWQLSRKEVESIKLLRCYGKQLVDAELHKALRNLRNGGDPELILNVLAQSLQNKFLDRPSRALSKSRHGKQVSLSEAVIQLFDLPTVK